MDNHTEQSLQGYTGDNVNLSHSLIRKATLNVYTCMRKLFRLLALHTY